MIFSSGPAASAPAIRCDDRVITGDTQTRLEFVHADGQAQAGKPVEECGEYGPQLGPRETGADAHMHP